MALTQHVHGERLEATLPHRIRLAAPGLILCLAVAGVSYAVGRLVPMVGPLIVAIAIGVVWANTLPVPSVFSLGIDVAAKKLLRIGIVFLGLQLVLGDIAELGVLLLVVVVAIVAGGLFGTILLGKLLHIRPGLVLLIACGFSICGAAAVAGAAGVTDPEGDAEEDTVTAVALVVIFGTLMIPLVPVVSSLLNLDAETAGMWAGGSIHEVAQVVAVGGVIGGGALTVAVIVKLARVLLLAPVVALLSIRQRRLLGGDKTSEAQLPPIVPLFIIGFIAMILLRSLVPLPDIVLTVGGLLQTVFLAAAMFGLGCGIKFRTLLNVGVKPFILATLSTLLVSGIAYVGVTLVG